MSSIANEIIRYCKRNRIGCGVKMSEALHFIEKREGKAHIDEIYQHCCNKLRKDPPTKMGLRKFFNIYRKHGLLFFIDSPSERVVQFKSTIPKDNNVSKNIRISPTQFDEESNSEVSQKKADKHIRLSIKIKDIINKIHPEWKVYIATYTTGTAGKIYQKIEEESGEEFWSIKLHSWIDNSELKDPDLIVVSEEKTKYAIEVKWGAVKGIFDTDILNFLGYLERKKNRDAREYGRTCYVRGPAVKDTVRYRHEEFPPEKMFTVDDETQFLLVSDFCTLRDTIDYQKYQKILFELEDQKDICDYLDIDNNLDDIISLRNYLTR